MMMPVSRSHGGARWGVTDVGVPLKPQRAVTVWSQPSDCSSQGGRRPQGGGRGLRRRRAQGGSGETPTSRLTSRGCGGGDSQVLVSLCCVTSHPNAQRPKAVRIYFS